MPVTESFTPSQISALREEMEDDFAWMLRSMTNGQAYGPSSAPDAWRPEPQSGTDDLGAVLHERAQAHLAAITAALRRLETGDYGKCARCGNRISFGRLSVMPEATLCSACDET